MPIFLVESLNSAPRFCTSSSPFFASAIASSFVVGPALTLDDGIEEYLHLPHTSKEFELELVLAIRVNARWAIATSETMSPREILKLPGINLDPDNYSLYNTGSNEPLPPDVAINLHRGAHFEAQRDGKYGAP